MATASYSSRACAKRRSGRASELAAPLQLEHHRISRRDKHESVPEPEAGRSQGGCSNANWQTSRASAAPAPTAMRVTMAKTGTAALLVAGVTLSAAAGDAEAAAANCLAKPDSTAPPGTHWYSRADRGANARCWFLAPDDRKKQYLPLPIRSPAQQTRSPPTIELQAQAPVEFIEATALLATYWSKVPNSISPVEVAGLSDKPEQAQDSVRTGPSDSGEAIWSLAARHDLSAGQSTGVSAYALPLIGSGLALVVVPMSLRGLRRRLRRAKARASHERAVRKTGIHASAPHEESTSQAFLDRSRDLEDQLHKILRKWQPRAGSTCSPF
jgi:opacity protein-like surface antigen